jgi:hypothetical protein
VFAARLLVGKIGAALLTASVLCAPLPTGEGAKQSPDAGAGIPIRANCK